MKPTIPIPCLGLVTDRRLCHSDMRALEDVVARAVKGGVNLVQLREKELPGGELLNLAKRLRKVTAGSASLFINDRVDVAIACDADGVQLGEKRMPVEAARKVAGDGLVIGRSVHSLEGAVEAEVEGADFLLVGAIFPTSSHGGEEPTGPQLLSRIADRTGIPLAGIGGITPANLREVIGAGASGVEVIRAILGAEDPEQAAAELRAALDGAWGHAHVRERVPTERPCLTPLGREPMAGRMASQFDATDG